MAGVDETRRTPRKFKLRLGIPDVHDLFHYWREGRETASLDKDESELAERVSKTLCNLLADPFYPGLESHEIDDLSRRYGRKVFQSYVDNASEQSWRLFWVYGPGRAEITWIGLEPHPEDDKNGAYARVRLSTMPPFPLPADAGPSKPRSR